MSGITKLEVEKGKILDEYSANAGLSRKYATRLLNEGYKRGKKKPGPVPKYSNDQEFLSILRVFWRTLNYPYGKLLKPTLEELSNLYVLNHGTLVPVRYFPVFRALKNYAEGDVGFPHR